MSLITPKHTGEIYTFFSSLEVLFQHDDWIDNETFKNELFELYVRIDKRNEFIFLNGKPAKKNDESDYTKDLQLPMYFGFAEADSFRSNSNKRITKSGRALFEAYQQQDNNKIISLFVEAIKKCSFGRNNFGCIRSDSDYEAPAILLRSIILLNGLTNKEYAYILYELDNKNRDYSEIISEVTINRETATLGLKYDNLNTDIKFITLFCNLGILFRDSSNQLHINKNIDKTEVYRIPLVNTDKITNMENHSYNNREEIGEIFNDKYCQLITAIRSKPFLLLAGISGTGKSQIVKELAFASCPNIDNLQDSEVSPGNYCLIEVKPNWHDSTELLGYDSAIKKHYVVTKFVKFVVKAMRYPEIPFFVCLDEMNLAPVEQYLAEFLSVLESRKLVDGKIISEPLIEKESFQKDIVAYDLFNIPLPKTGDLQIQSAQLSDADLGDNAEIWHRLQKEGLSIPQNLIVIGTVNMDETTHQFSRKVIDRAMTFEMNEADFDSYFEDNITLKYVDEPLSADLFLARNVSGNQALEEIDNLDDNFKKNVVNKLKTLNAELENTPFKIAYRVQNELVLYFAELLREDDTADQEQLLVTALDDIMMMKVLPRIEGDDELLGTKEKGKLHDLLVYAQNNHLERSVKKIDEMLDRLNGHFTSFWP